MAILGYDHETVVMKFLTLKLRIATEKTSFNILKGPPHTTLYINQRKGGGFKKIICCALSLFQEACNDERN